MAVYIVYMSSKSLWIIEQYEFNIILAQIYLHVRAIGIFSFYQKSETSTLMSIIINSNTNLNVDYNHVVVQSWYLRSDRKINVFRYYIKIIYFCYNNILLFIVIIVYLWIGSRCWDILRNLEILGKLYRCTTVMVSQSISTTQFDVLIILVLIGFCL